jgi:hypothetical protein
VTGLVVAVVLVVAVLAFGTARPQQVEDRVLIPDVAAEAGERGLEGGRVVLRVRRAELHVEPAGPGEPLRVEARYDVNAFTLTERLEPGTAGNDAWTYRLTFGGGDRPGAFPGLVSWVRGTTARIHVFLPADVPLDLEMDVDGGGAVARLGGLWLRTAAVDVESGAFDLSVEQPLRQPMESLAIRTANGGCLANHLGNASPRRLDVSYRRGGIDMDLGGRWVADAEIHINGDMGGGTVHLPRDVILQGLDLGGIDPPVPSDLSPPTLAFSVSTGMGWLDLSDIHFHDLPGRIGAGSASHLPSRNRDVRSRE